MQGMSWRQRNRGQPRDGEKGKPKVQQELGEVPPHGSWCGGWSVASPEMQHGKMRSFQRDAQAEATL